MPSLLLRNLFFTLLQPGIVAGLVPYLIAKDAWQNIWSVPFQWNHIIAIIIFLAGLGVLLYCVYQFAIDGRGTLSPADPTKNLVIKGLYRYVRNPMYIGVMMMLIAEAIFISSAYLLYYAGIVFIAFNVFIIFFEEPRLKRDFGDEYVAYSEKVGRWY